MPHDPMHITVEDPQDSGMTEIALALAMGFFSLMILTLLSMGAGDGNPALAEGSQTPETVLVQPSEPSPEIQSNTDDSEANAVRDDLVIIYDGGRYLDTKLKPIDPKAAMDAARPGQRVVLAVDPDLPLGDIMEARRGLDRSGVVITGFGTDWRKRLEADR